METLLSSPIFTVLFGIALGYYCKRIVLWVVTGIVTPMALYMFAVTWNKEIATLIGFVAVINALELLVPMWITHIIRNIRRQGDNGWWKKLKTKILN